MSPSTPLRAGGQILQGDVLARLRELPDESVEIVVTSPPYNLVREWSGGGPASSMKSLEARYEDWYPDMKEEIEYQDWQKQVVRECLRVARSSVFYNHKVRYAYKRRRCIYHPMDWLREFPIWCEIIWDRCGGQGGNSRRWIVSDERVYQIRRPRKWYSTGHTTVWRIAPSHVDGHVCAFPAELVRRCIEATTDPGDVVLDPFMGSGTTALVAQRMGRDWLGIEINPEYVELARRRLAGPVTRRLFQ